MRRWRRVMAVGCTHGELVAPHARKQVLAFRRAFNPEIRIELGDIVDTACFRFGAGESDLAHSPHEDEAAAHRWLEEYQPTHITWGNHDWRLAALQSHPKAILAELAGRIWQGLEGKAVELHARTVPYDIEKGWIDLGGVAWGHGFMFNQQALRDHAEMLGQPVVIAHLHSPQQMDGRTRKGSTSYCVGALADDERLDYGRRRRQTLTHGHGVVYGEVSGDQARLWLARARNGEGIVFPPGVL